MHVGPNSGYALWGQREDGPPSVGTGVLSCAVKRALHVDQARDGIFAVGPAAEAVEYFLRAVRRDAF